MMSLALTYKDSEETASTNPTRHDILFIFLSTSLLPACLSARLPA
jgi:hypothetical protein